MLHSLLVAAAVAVTGCPAFEIDGPTGAGWTRGPAKVVRAADFGFSETNRLNGAAIRAALAEAKRIGAQKVVLAPGRYLCHDASGIPLVGFADFEFDGAGAELVFCRPRQNGVRDWGCANDPAAPRSNFLLKDCRRVRFGNLKMDWDWSVDPLAAFARLVAVSTNGTGSCDFELVDYARHPRYGRLFPVQTVCSVAETKDGFEPFLASQYYGNCEGHAGAKTAWLGPNRIRLWPYVKPDDPSASVDPEFADCYTPERNRTGTAAFAPHVGRLFRLASCYYGKGAVTMDACAHLTVHDIRIHSAFGMGFVTSGPTHHWQLVDCTIAPPEGVKRPITVTADSNHVIDSRGWAKFIRFSTTMGQDDCSNCHDKISSAKRTGPATLAFTHARGNAYFGVKAGDTVELREFNFEPTGVRAKIVATDGDRLTLDRDVPEPKFGEFMLFNCAYATDRILMKDCVFANAPGRICLMGNDITVEGCLFRNLSGIVLKLQTAYMRARWAEGHGATNVLVRGCTFDSCQRQRRYTFGKVVAENFVGRTLRRDYGEGNDLHLPFWRGIVDGVLFENNVWTNATVPIAHLCGAGRVAFRNNRIFPAAGAADVRPVCADSDPVVWEGNRVSSGWSIGDGLLLKDGRPHFWLGNGCDLGAAQATPVGLWLAKLQGVESVAAPHNSATFSGRKRADGTCEITARANPACASWVREAIDMGFLCQGGVEGQQAFAFGPLRKVLADFPELADRIRVYGHYKSMDLAYPLMREALANRRIAAWTPYAATGGFVGELYREPGYDPDNLRSVRSFREWAARKYGAVERANAAWHTSFASWDDAGPAFVTIPYEGKSRVRRSRTRLMERERFVELYYDWMRFCSDDLLATFTNEVADVRTGVPGLKFGMDFRSHMVETDGYFAYDPPRFAPHLDVSYVHNSGFKPYRYDNAPWNRETVLKATGFTLLTANYFRNNQSNPIVDSENIVSVVPGAEQSVEGIRRNDLAGLGDARWTVKPKAFAGYDGLKDVPVADYDTTFTVPARCRNDLEDGSRRFFLCGWGETKAEHIFLNGKLVRYNSRPGDFWQADVSTTVVYGGANRLTFRVNNDPSLTNLAPHVYFVASDGFAQTTPFGEKAYSAYLWSALTGGLSGLQTWNWIVEDPLKPYLPSLAKRLGAAAERTLGALRHRRSDLAVLYPFNWCRGLPTWRESRGFRELDWFSALAFLGHEPEVLSEIGLGAKLSARKYRLLFVPHATVTDRATVEAIERYVEAGGEVYVTDDSLRRVFDDWGPGGFDAFAAAHPDRVHRASSGLELADLLTRLEPVVGAPRLKVSFGPSDERPLVHRVFEGTDRAKLLYFANYGGRDQRVTFALPPELKGWTLFPLQGSFDGNVTVVEGSHGVSAALLLAPGEPAPDVAVEPARRAKMARLAELAKEDPADPRPAVLFPCAAQAKETMYFGKLLFPEILERLDRMGYRTISRPIAEWTPELLASCRMVALVEGRTEGVYDGINRDESFSRRIADYVEKGGRVFILAWTPKTNCALGFTLGDFARRTFGFRAVAASLVEEPGIFCCRPIDLGSSGAKPVLSSASGRPIALTLEKGRGRVFACSDVMAFQPGRIDSNGRARFLDDILAWLLIK